METIAGQKNKKVFRSALWLTSTILWRLKIYILIGFSVAAFSPGTILLG
jgi:hypothetical protein